MPSVAGHGEPLLRAIATIGLWPLFEQQRVEAAMLSVQATPSCRVHAAKDFQPDELLLVPWTSAVGKVTHKDGHDMRVEVVWGQNTTSFELARPSGMGKTVEVAFWRLRHVTGDTTPTCLS